ncbi:hypothetical protein Q3G72_026805 [Acer saccharum]|nr:hypothetical protein Q3G72_026805 [Acer saccharum]
MESLQSGANMNNNTKEMIRPGISNPVGVNTRIKASPSSDYAYMDLVKYSDSVSCKISFTLCNSGIVPGNLVGVATAATTNHGLDPLLIQAFPTFAYSTVKDCRHKKYSLQCAICLAEFRDDSMLRLLKLVIMFFIKTASTFGLSLTRHARFVVETSIFRKKHWKNSGTCPQQPSE